MGLMMNFTFRALIVVVCILASAITVASQFYYIYTTLGEDWLVTEDFGRHLSLIDGTTSAPYRYRILTDNILECALRLVPFGTISEEPRKYVLVAVGFRLIQNFTIFLLAFWYFRTLDIPPSTSFVGILLLCYGMCFAFYMSDLSFYTYTEIAFFLLAGIFINLNKDWFILPLTVVATLNREGAVFIPIMLFSARLSQCDSRSLFGFKSLSSRFVQQCALSLLGFSAVYFGIRYIMGPAGYGISRYGDVYPGLLLLYLNIINPMTWIGLVQMYGLLPLTLIFVKHWPTTLRSYFFFLVLPWFIVVLTFGSADETRLFLVPLLIVFIPAALRLLNSCESHDTIA